MDSTIHDGRSPIFNGLWLTFTLALGVSTFGVSAWGAPPLIITSPNPELAGGIFGRSLDRVGDINNDGVDDFIVGAPGEIIPAGGSIADARGRAYVLSGADGTALRTHEGLADGDQLGFNLLPLLIFPDSSLGFGQGKHGK